MAQKYELMNMPNSIKIAVPIEDDERVGAHGAQPRDVHFSSRPSPLTQYQLLPLYQRLSYRL